MKNATILITTGILILASLAVVRINKYHRIKNNENNPGEMAARSERVYNFNNLLVDKQRQIIEVEARVTKNTGWVQFLFYAHGYNWLKEECAIILNTDLKSLQKGLALLNWQMWDDLWHGKQEYKFLDPKIYIEHEGKKYNPLKSLEDHNDVRYRDLIFWGSPYFDEIAFKTPPDVDCSGCPMLNTETRVLRKQFQRESGDSGYYINSDLFPQTGETVRVIFDFSRMEHS
ncbi:hypothetical protein QA601_01350 [Chitinispirillales bacterium ANBcel5]|uniref:hypothetical protein n=1 Tax=Cellulosispirillum alkaliphilum TaxID=3039283 RepID=UPI002A56E822|nr:hypothetical protein [Chitinispirillales bacterium ANBcel5]